MERTRITFIAALLTIGSSAQRVVPFGTGSAARIQDMEVWNGQLVVTGEATMELLGVEGDEIQSWDGTQVFSFPDLFGTVAIERSLKALDGELYVAGRIAPMGNVVRWDGSAWQTVGEGLPEYVTELCVHDGQLHAGTRDGLVCRWNGTVWDTLGGRFNDDVRTVVSHQGELYAGGWFTADANGTPVAYLARWEASAWVQVGVGLADVVYALASIPAGLFVGGNFNSDGGGADLPGWAIWNNTTFSVPPLARMPQYAGSQNDRGLAVLPDGSFIVGGSLVNGTEVTELDFRATDAAAFDGHVFLSSFYSVAYTGYGPADRFSELIDGQHHTVVDAGAMRATVSCTPSLFERFWNQQQGLEVPKDEGVHSVYSASPWVIGKQDGLWRRSLPRYIEENLDSLLWAGPQQAVVRDADFYRRYHQVWTLDQYTIDQHAAHWNDPGYETPYAIATWPGNGDPANGEPALLAPFQDQDGDDLYEPEAGDHPLIRGDRAAYTIQRSDISTNDNDVECDIHLMVYNYAEPSLADRYNSTFINLRLINRSGADYDSVRFGLFTDMDLGGHFDDLTECDSTRGMWFTYNGDDLDADTVQQDVEVTGYGSQPPAIGFKFLNAPMTSHSAWQDSEDTQTISGLIDLLNGTPGGVPHVGPGYSSRFQYPGGSWSDVYIAGDTTADRRSVAGAGPYTWPTDDTLCFDIAVIHARAPSGGPYASVAALKQRADAVQAWFDAAEFACNTITNVVAVEETRLFEWSAYPIPTDDLLHLSGPQAATDLRVDLLDAMGRLVLTRPWPAGRASIAIDLSAMDIGAYVVVVSGPDVQRVLRAIKVR